MTDTTILITGAAGFIGSSLADALLKQGHRVVGVDNFCDFYDPAIKRRHVAQAMANPRFTLVEADIRDRQAVMDAFQAHRPTGVVHLAAMAGVRPSIANPAYYVSVNLDGTTHLLDAAVASGCQRFAFASSSSVYGNNQKVPFAEADRVDYPISPYAATKKAGELLCHTYSHLHGLSVACLRFFTVFGPRQRPDLAISKFLKRVAQKQAIPVFGDGSTSRDYTYIDDIVQGIGLAFDWTGQHTGQFDLFNLGGDHPITLADLIKAIEQVVGQQAIIDRQPMQPGDVDRTWADLSHSQAVLGYRPTTSIQAGLAKQWAWMQGQKA